MAEDGNGRKDLYRKLYNDPATREGTKKYSFNQWEQKLAESPDALAKIGAYAIEKKWASDFEDFSNKYAAGLNKPQAFPPAPKPQAAPVAPPPVEQVAPPIGIAAPKPVKEPAPSVTDITRQMAFQPPVEAPVEPVQMEPEGFFEGLGTQFKRGLAQGRAIQSVNMGQLRDAAQGKNLGAIPYEQIAAANKAVKEFGQTQSDIDLATKEGIIKDAWDVVKALPGVTIESLASLGRSGLEEALVGAGTGAAAGSIIPGLGTAAGGGLGATAGMVQAGRNMEYFGTLMQELEANGVDITDARQLREGLAKYGKSADKTAITRANTIAAVESALPIAGKAAGTLAGRVGSKVAQKPLQAVGKALTYEPVAGPLGGATGELAAQIASGQEIDPQAIALEAGGEGAATVAAVARAIKGEKKVTDITQFSPAVQENPIITLERDYRQERISRAEEQGKKPDKWDVKHLQKLMNDPEAWVKEEIEYFTQKIKEDKKANIDTKRAEANLAEHNTLLAQIKAEKKGVSGAAPIAAEAPVAPAETITAPEVSEGFPSEEQIADDIQNRRFATFTYSNESEVPEQFRDRISSRGETNGVPFVRVTLPQSVADYEVSRTAPETAAPITEEVPSEEVVVPPQEEDEDLAAFGREVEAIEQAAPVAPAEEEVNIVEPDSELSQKILENGEQVVSRLDAEKRIGDGERLFGFNEQDDSLVELSLKNLGAFPVDTIIAVRPEFIEEAPQVAPEVVAAAPVEEVAPEVAPEAPAAPAPKGRKRAALVTPAPAAPEKEEAPLESKTSSDYGNYLLDLIEQKQKDLGWKDYAELRKGLVKSFEQTKEDRGEPRAISNLESIYVGYLPEGTQAGAYQAIKKNFEKQQQAVKPEVKPEPTAKKIDKKSVQASLDKAKEEYEKAKSAFDKKRSELDKTTREDVKDLFGQRKVEMKAQGLFEMPRISPGQRERAIQPFRDRMNKAKEEVNRLTKMLEEGEEVSQKISFNKAVEEIKSKPLSHVFGIKMGSNQAEGTYISTEKENRYAKSAPNAKISKAEVSIENPLVVTDDIGLVDLRNKILNRNLVEFTEEDFELYEIPDEPTVDDLNESGVEKLSKLVTKDLKAKGYDSIYFPESKIQEGELIVFDRKNVKFTDYEQVQGAGEKIRERKGAPKAKGVVRPKAKPVRNAGKSPDAITARTITIYGDPYATSLQYLMDATYHPDLLEAIFGGPSRTTKSGRKDISGERKSRIQFLDKNSPIKTADRLAEILAERYAEENNIDVKDAEQQHDFASIATDIISSYASRNQMVREVLRLNEQQNEEFNFMYNPENIYGEGYNEDIAKEIDGIMDDLPDSYWEGKEITDEEFGNLFAEEEAPSTPEFTSSQSSEAATAFDKAKTSKGFDKKYGKGAYKALSDITKNFEDIMDKVSEKIKQDCIV